MVDTEKYILNLKKGGSNAEEVIEKVKKGKVDELESARIELEIEKLKAEIKKIQGQGQSVPSGMATDFTARIMQLAQVDPAKAKAFLDGLDEDSLSKMAYLMAMENDRTGAFLTLAKSPGTSVKDLVEVAKLMRSNGGTDLKGVAEVFKLGIEAGKANQPQPQSMQEAASFILGILKPFQETLNVAQQEAFKANLETIRAQIPPPLETQIKNLKAMAGELGLSGGGSEKITELNIELEKMRQSHDLDMERIRWEKEKYLLGKESDTEKWTQISGMFSPLFSGPEIRSAVKSIGESVGKTIDQAAKPTASAKPTAAQPQVASFICPSCNTELGIPVDQIAPDTKGIKCPKCGAMSPLPTELKEGSLPPPEEKTTSTRLKASYT